MRHNRTVVLRQKIASVLLLASLTLVPELAWAGAHFVEHHHGIDSADSRHEHLDLAVLVEALLHGHHHPGEVPDHDHPVLLFSSSVRPQAFRGLASPIPAAPQAATIVPHALARASAVPSRARSSGPSPPLLLLLCTLLI